jgi:hypothetical protein
VGRARWSLTGVLCEPHAASIPSIAAEPPVRHRHLGRNAVELAPHRREACLPIRPDSRNRIRHRSRTDSSLVEVTGQAASATHRHATSTTRAATTVRVDEPASRDSSSFWKRLETTQKETASPHRLLRFSRSRFRFVAREALPSRRGSASWLLRIRRRTPIAGIRTFRGRVAPMLRACRRRAACRRYLG